MRKSSVRAIAFAALLAAAPALAQENTIVITPTDDEDPNALPAGAPEGDYEFVGWCVGILSTHMNLYPRLRTELDAISRRWDTVEEDAQIYAQQQAAGQRILADFQRAMRAAEAASPRNIVPVGQDAVQSGQAMWSLLGTVDARNQAYSWMNWALPSRCVTVADALETRSNLNSALLQNSQNSASSAGEGGAAIDLGPQPQGDLILDAPAPSGEDRLR